MEMHHLAHIHAVNVVGAEDGDQGRVVLDNQVAILEHGVGGALEPFRALAHLRRHDADELARDDVGQHPGAADMLDQRLRLVLHQQVNRMDIGIDEVAEDEVHDAVAPGERYRRFGAFRRQRVEPRAFAAGHDHGKNLWI